MFTPARPHFTCAGSDGSPALLASPVRAALSACILAGLVACSSEEPSNTDLVAEGKQTFRHDTFGDETR